MKNLEIYGVQEMDAKEIKETDGGGGWLGLAIGLICLACYVIDNWDRVQEGWADGAEAAANN